MKEPAHVAYDAYREALKGLPYAPTLEWADLRASERMAWRAAVEAVSP